MLILTRRLNEKLTIGSEVTVTVLGIKGNQVRLGISAPQSVEVHREEIYDRIREERAGGDPTQADTAEGSVPVRVKKSKLL